MLPPCERRTAYSPPFQQPKVYYDKKEGDRKVIHIAKPHGSCNFTSWMTREVIIKGEKQPLYPIKDCIALRGSSLKILEAQNIHDPVSIADLVLPGEWTCWNNSVSTKLDWAEEQKNIFVEESKDAKKLLVVGFGYGEPDRPEFDELLTNMPKFQEVHIVHPTVKPTKKLLEAVSIFSDKEIRIWKTPPP